VSRGSTTTQAATTAGLAAHPKRTITTADAGMYQPQPARANHRAPVEILRPSALSGCASANSSEVAFASTRGDPFDRQGITPPPPGGCSSPNSGSAHTNDAADGVASDRGNSPVTLVEVQRAHTVLSNLKGGSSSSESDESEADSAPRQSVQLVRLPVVASTQPRILPETSQQAHWEQQEVRAHTNHVTIHLFYFHRFFIFVLNVFSLPCLRNTAPTAVGASIFVAASVCWRPFPAAVRHCGLLGRGLTARAGGFGIPTATSNWWRQRQQSKRIHILPQLKHVFIIACCNALATPIYLPAGYTYFPRGGERALHLVS
jgi:hypothetical protein